MMKNRTNRHARDSTLKPNQTADQEDPKHEESAANRDLKPEIYKHHPQFTHTVENKDRHEHVVITNLLLVNTFMSATFINAFFEAIVHA